MEVPKKANHSNMKFNGLQSYVVVPEIFTSMPIEVSGSCVIVPELFISTPTQYQVRVSWRD